MDLHLEGRTALVTGGTGGIGLATAAALAREGAKIIIAGRDHAKLDAALKEIRSSAAGEVIGIVANAATQQGADAIVTQAPEIDILINNLGFHEIKAFTSITDEDWLHLFETNVLSGIRLARYLLPSMLTKNWGRIIFVSSSTAISTPAMMVHYGMTKTAELAISRGLAEQTKGTAVTVNAVLPGPIQNAGMLSDVRSMLGGSKDSDAEVEKTFFKTHYTTSLLQRLIEPAEVADLIAFLVSQRALAINGAALHIDGGATPTVV
ncbi:SDR family NAD(P)-dependent oxidoreductase [Mesorhizobium sp.]|uniref:SDR family NAD(P)-dependent oxidoreductase n=1 Tax=Mesorhizobium sp. TaxID=1871066 RepID=UPI000FE5C17F|nr:SDR family NAD(P)-dependent oxidoreductase [Mesorhizobium sp.]RWC58438.1 MAG: SDR family NAD(P)-dependent oxidoreductase [Mesorhizobium sp.]RWC64923.1 MAG: SDR family NAD(P)-dependent oxidoreductase [Mesorhizobium sp.]